MALMQSNDRILILEKDDPKNKDIGLLDVDLFQGNNSLHCRMDPSTCMWTFHYERGIVPPALKETFTSFKYAKAHAEDYFRKKKIKVVGVK